MTETIVGKGRLLTSTYEWEINDYLSYQSLKTGSCISSPSFSHAQHSSWNLKLYPKGDTKSRNGKLSLFLVWNEDTEAIGKIQARYLFTLLDSTKKVILIHVQKEMLLFTDKEYWGVIFDKPLLANNQSISMLNKIIIVCELITEEAKLYKAILTINEDRIQHFKEFKNQLNNPKFSDVKFSIQNQEIHAHKMVLVANSTVFAAMFEHKMRENKENKVTIEDVNYIIFNELLTFLYTGECTISKDTMNELFQAANKYQLLKLKEMCEDEICKNICIDNAVAYLQLADTYSAERLKKETIDFIVQHGKEILDRPEFDSLRILQPDLFKDVFRVVFARVN